MEQEKLWSIVEFAMRDLELSHPLLMSLIHCLPFPINPKPPPHILRLALLRNLLSASVSHRLLSPFTLKTLERLLPPPTDPPSPSLCTAYSSHLFYLSTAPGFSVEVDAVLSRLSNYCFAMKLLDPWRAMIAKQEKIRTSPVDRVVSARDKAIIALRDFVDEELRAMEPPFLLRSHQESCKENQNVPNLAPSKKSDGGTTDKETEAIQRETSPTKTGIKQVDGTCTPRRSDRIATQDETQANERGALPSKIGAKQVDSYCMPSKKSDKGANQKETSPVKTCAKQADGTCTSDSTWTSADGIACAKQNHIYRGNQQSRTTSGGINHERKQVTSKENSKETVRNASGTSTSHGNNTNVEMKNRVTRASAHHFMERNPTAHVYEWNDSIDRASEMEQGQTVVQVKRTRQLEGQNGQIPKRRQVRKWLPDEEEVLRKAVKEIGKGNWKEILDTYPDEFAGRSAVDLKDKWRNMTRY